MTHFETAQRWMDASLHHSCTCRGLGRGVDLIVELVRPGPDDLLQIVVSEFAVVKRVITGVDRVFLIWRCPLNHHCACWLIPGVVLPKTNISAVGNAGLNRPLIIDLRGRENSCLHIIVDYIHTRM